MDDTHFVEPHRAHHDPHRVVCVGDGFFGPESASAVLERLCRLEDPESPWKFWHLGENDCTADRLRNEVSWKALGHDAGRLLVSLGSGELKSPSPDPRTIADGIRSCLEVLADKGPRSIWLLLPAPTLWPSAIRPVVQALRQELASEDPRWRLVDVEPRAAAFVAAQAAHPDDAAALTDHGPVLTASGALLLALEIRNAWRT
ncbi:MAG: hypothetical protein H6686_02130 [Fibrobacteria bacterium]|nr:hypothetical protein [Fibrobacteria bacterium]